MKKTLTANISGTVFHIEEDAFEKMHRYLNSIRSQFTGSEGQDEIMSDIEARIAELLQERLDGLRQVISITDVDHVIAIMGQPEDYLDPTEDGAGAQTPPPPPPSASTTWTTAGTGRKRLFRDTEDKWIGGVLGGIGAYFSIDPLILRIIYIVLLFLGVGWLIYLILWIVVPPATTAAEKLEMRGEPVNVENIKRVFDEGAERVRTGAQTVTNEAREIGRRYGPQAKRGTDEFLNFLGEMFRILFKVITKVVGVVLLIGGALLAVMLMVLMLGQFTVAGIFDDADGISNFHDLALLIFGERGWLNLTWIALIAFVLVPVIGLIHGGLSLLFNISSPKWFGWTLTSVWIISIVILSVMGIRLATDLSRREVVETRDRIEVPVKKVITLTSSQGGRALNDHDALERIRIQDNTVQLGWATLDVRQSKDTLYHLVVRKSARGASDKMAANRAASISAEWHHLDSVIDLASWYSFDTGDLFRGQHVRYILEVPIGAAVVFEGSVGGMLDDVANVTKTWDHDMIGHTWTMTPEGLESPTAPSRKRDGRRHKDHGPKNWSISIKETRPEIAITGRSLQVMPDLLGIFLRRI